MLKRRLWIGVAISFLVVGAIGGLSWFFSPCQNQGYLAFADDTEKNACSTYLGSSLVGIVGAFDWLTNRQAEFWIAWSTALLAFVTAGLVWVAKQQHRTTRAQLRAYLFVGDAQIVATETAEPRAQLDVRNGGQTPAYAFSVVRTARVFNMREVPDFPPPAQLVNISRSYLPPGPIARTELDLRDIVNADVLARLRQGTHVLFVWGQITYRDVFGEEHHGRFRLSIGGIEGWPRDNRLIVSPEGNEET